MLDARFEGILRSVEELPSARALADEQDLRGDLGMDSLKLMDLIVLMEAAYDVEFGDDAMNGINTVEQHWAKVDRAS